MKKFTTGAMMCGLLSGVCGFTVDAQKPTVVVGIMVDQLRTDYLEQLRPYFGDNGFNRLFRDGLYIPDVDFKGTVSDAPSGAAVIYTGAWPVTNGMAAAEVFEPHLKRNVPALAVDASKLRYEYSPANLRVSTVADEFFIDNGTLTKIYSVAGDVQSAVVTAGHAANAAIWLDDANGRWSSPGYYTGMPPVVSNKNRTSPLSSRLSSTIWRPLNPAVSKDDFTYGFNGRDAYAKLKQSAPGNTEVTNVAIDLLKSLNGSGAGMVNISYSLAPITFDYDGDSRPELFDSYIRLDAELARLFEAIDAAAGSGRPVVFLSSTGYAEEPAITRVDARIPTGEITLKKVESLLNSYLSASFGNADYVALIDGGKLYLDSKTISAKGLDIKRLRNEAKEFLLKMSGVSEVFSIDEVIHSDNRRMQDIALGIDPKNSPDIFLLYTPGWTVVNDNVYPPVSFEARLSSPTTPAFILAPGIAPDMLTYSVDATAIAPTVSSILRIRPPNGAVSKKINLSLP